LTLAKDQIQEVQEKVEAAAADLDTANIDVKEKIAEGATTVPAQKALADGEKVERQVHKAAAGLLEVNETLARATEDLQHTQLALTKSRQELADTEASLAVARGEEKEARQRALHDPKTGLPNRDLFDDRLAHGISLADRHAWTLAVLFLDLNRFKHINDTHGHAAGDQVLHEVAERLLRQARAEDTVCRNGGDEFLYLLMNPKGRENIERIVRAILKTIAQPIAVQGEQLVITSSIGIAIYPDHGTSGDQLIQNADAAMYRAKERKTHYMLPMRSSLLERLNERGARACSSPISIAAALPDDVVMRQEIIGHALIVGPPTMQTQPPLPRQRLRP